MIAEGHHALEVDASVGASTAFGGHARLAARGSTVTLDVSSLHALSDLAKLAGPQSAMRRAAERVADALAFGGLVGHIEVSGRRVATLGCGVTANRLARLLGFARVDLHAGGCVRAVASSLGRRFRGLR